MHFFALFFAICVGIYVYNYVSDGERNSSFYRKETRKERERREARRMDEHLGHR
jgi:hypothetical protein